MPIQPSSSKVVLDSIKPITNSDVEIFPEIKFSNFKKEESSLNLNVQSRRFLIVVFLDTDSAYQFPIINVYCNVGGGAIEVSIKGKSYYYMNSYAKTVKDIFGIRLTDINGRYVFTPFGFLPYGYCEFGFPVNSNYMTLNGITF